MAPRGARRGSSFRRAVISVVVGGLLATLLVVGVPALTTSTTACALGSPAGTAYIWTPQILVNVPLGGFASWSINRGNWTFSSGSLVVGQLPAAGGGDSLEPGWNETGINGVVGLAEWTFFHVRNVTLASSNGVPCTQPYLAAIDSPLYCGGVGNLSTILPLADNSSDFVEPHVVPPQLCFAGINATPGAELWFNTAYNSTLSVSAETLSLCSPTVTGPLNVTLEGTAEYPIVVSMTLTTGEIHASGVMSWTQSDSSVGPTAAYGLPDGWVWNISALTPGTLPTLDDPQTTSLLAFERGTC